MTRAALERHQVWLYAAAILAGLGLGTARPALAGAFEAALWPALALTLYATFTQVPLARLPEAFRDGRFIGAALLGNFVLVPLVVWALLALVPDEPAIRLGVLLVLLVPCTDWFIAFTHLGGGDTRRAIALTPPNLLAQIALLPYYLWLFMGDAFAEILAAERVAIAVALLIAAPLLAAWLTERWAARQPRRAVWIDRVGWLPAPLLALVLFLVAAAQAPVARDALPAIGAVLGVFVAYLLAAAAIGTALGRLARLTPASSRTLIFTLGTRNSFVVLPIALALSTQWRIAAIVIVFQSLVELLGMLVYLRIVPRFLVPAAPATKGDASP